MRSSLNLLNWKTAVSSLLLFASACNTPEKLLCRSWRVVDVDLDEKTVNLTKEQKPLVVQQLRDSCLFVFNADHSYSLKLPQRIERGTWTFSKGHDTLYVQTDHGGALTKINTLNKSTMDADSYAKDGTHVKYVLAPANK